jgi:hypothetical protein
MVGMETRKRKALLFRGAGQSITALSTSSALAQAALPGKLSLTHRPLPPCVFCGVCVCACVCYLLLDCHVPEHRSAMMVANAKRRHLMAEMIDDGPSKKGCPSAGAFA